MAAESDVLFGVAGWSYADWKGIVYSSNCRDTLRAVAERVDLIEINSTFYRSPSAKNCRSWVERTEDLGTMFTAKLPHEFTHERRFDDALVEGVRDVANCSGAGGFAYFRLHGRNRAWFRKGAGRDEVYDWEYSAREVGQVEDRPRRIQENAVRTVVVANSHFQGKAMKLIEQLIEWYRGAAGP